MTNTAPRALVALLAVFSLLAGGCGGDDKEVSDLLDKTFSGNQNVRSGRVALAISLNAQGLPQLRGPVALRVTGPFQGQGNQELPKFDFDLALSAVGQSFKAGAVSTGTAGFLELQGAAYKVDDPVFASFRDGYRRAQAQQGKEGTRENPTLGSLGVDPRDWLEDAQLRDDEKVAGTDTRHISAGVDVGRLLTDVNRVLARAGQLGVAQQQALPGALTAEQRKQAEEAITDASFDVWTGKDDKVLRRLRVQLSFEVPEGRRQSANGLRGGELSFELQIADVNRPQTVSAPANPRPFSQLREAIQGLIGAAGAARGGAPAAPQPPAGQPPAAGAAPGGAPGGSGSPQSDAYLECLRQAGNDLARAQRCAALLQR